MTAKSRPTHPHANTNGSFIYSYVHLLISQAVSTVFSLKHKSHPTRNKKGQDIQTSSRTSGKAYNPELDFKSCAIKSLTPSSSWWAWLVDPMILQSHLTTFIPSMGQNCLKASELLYELTSPLGSLLSSLPLSTPCSFFWSHFAHCFLQKLKVAGKHPSNGIPCHFAATNTPSHHQLDSEPLQLSFTLHPHHREQILLGTMEVVRISLLNVSMNKQRNDPKIPGDHWHRNRGTDNGYFRVQFFLT